MKTSATAILFLSFFFTFQNNFAQSEASTLLSQAAEQAKKEHKAVFVKFEASWCGWCKRMTSNMNDESIKNLFDDNYVVVHMTVMETPNNKSLETPGGMELLQKNHAEKAGLPFWMIYDADLNLITDAFDDQGQNLGCPASEDEVPVFLNKLKMSSDLTDAELQAISEKFILKK